MRRFRGDTLPARPRIALITSDALGNYVAVTPLIQMLRSRYPEGLLHYFGGTRTEELWGSETAIDAGFPVLGSHPRTVLEMVSGEAPYDLVINLENSDWARCLATQLSTCQTLLVGPVIDHEGRAPLSHEDGSRGDLWRDRDWTATDLPSRYPFLQSGFIAEIFCRLCYLEGAVPPYRVPSCDPGGPVPDVLISTAASLPEKLWPTKNWFELVDYVKSKGMTVGVIGAARPTQVKYWLGAETEDALVGEGGIAEMRGRLSLPQVVGALARAKQVVTIDNGILHLTAATGTPTVGLFRPAIRRLWAPPVPSVDAIAPPDGCAVAEIPVEQVISRLGL